MNQVLINHNMCGKQLLSIISECANNYEIGILVSIDHHNDFVNRIPKHIKRFKKKWKHIENTNYPDHISFANTDMIDYIMTLCGLRTRLENDMDNFQSLYLYHICYNIGKDVYNNLITKGIEIKHQLCLEYDNIKNSKYFYNNVVELYFLNKYCKIEKIKTEIYDLKYIKPVTQIEHCFKHCKWSKRYEKIEQFLMSYVQKYVKIYDNWDPYLYIALLTDFTHDNYDGLILKVFLETDDNKENTYIKGYLKEKKLLLKYKSIKDEL